LLPAFEFVAGLLDSFLIRPEIKEQIGLRHDGSLRRQVVASQGAARGKVRLGYWNGRHFGPVRAAEGVTVLHTGAVLAYDAS
jgi:hypothetical protein